MVGISGIMLRDRFSRMILCSYPIRVVYCTIFYYYVVIYIITNYTVIARNEESSRRKMLVETRSSQL